MGFKKKTALALAAFLVVVLAACGWRSCTDRQEQQAAKDAAAQAQAESQQDGAQSVLSDEQKAAAGSYDADAAALADMLASYSWVSTSGAALDIREGVASLRTDGNSAAGKPFIITSAEHISDSDGEAWRASVEVDGKASVLEAGKAAGTDTWNMTCAALDSGAAFTTAAAHGDPVVDAVPGSFAELIGQEAADSIKAGVSAFVSEQYPSAATAVAQKTAELDLEHGTATLKWKLDNKAASTVKAVVSLSDPNSFEVSGGN